MIQEVFRVQITDDGDMLAYSADILPSEVAEYKLKLLTENVSWSSVHLHSGTSMGFTDWYRMDKYQAVTCRACKLRVKIPIEVETIQQLIDWAGRR